MRIRLVGRENNWSNWVLQGRRPAGLAMRRGGAKRQTEFLSAAKKRRAEQTCEPQSVAPQGEAAAEAQKRQQKL